ncbi:MAG: 3,4-dihydroxy-2-butanone-4-phosphate synthase [Candidatus Micrarchaeota archaeon]
MLQSALAALRKGRMIIVHDGNHREGEADLMVPAQFATPDKISTFRKDGGGLICFATDKKTRKRLGMSFLAETFRNSPNSVLRKLVISRTPYGDESAFSVSINHRGTYTGITDNDRSKTIGEMAKLIAKKGNISKEFAANFYVPGHVPLLFARDLRERKGHTELAVRLCELASLPPAMLICEMLGNGNALSFEDAKKYAKKHKIPILEYSEILNAKNKG